LNRVEFFLKITLIKTTPSKNLKFLIKNLTKQKNNPDPKLTPQQKQYNKTIGTYRVKVENAIVFRVPLTPNDLFSLNLLKHTSH